MSIVVADVSVVIKWFIPELHSTDAQRLLSNAYEIHTPDFMQIEFMNILVKKRRRGELDEGQADAISGLLSTLPIVYHPWQELLTEAYAVANQTYRSLYDCLYLALALSLHGKMVTADLKFYNALRLGALATSVQWVQDT